jgi:CBS domain-containing protein
MIATLNVEPTGRLALRAETAADLMTPNPISIRVDATLREAVALLADRGYSAAPVINEAGLPVGVLSRSDILIHDRETVVHAGRTPDYYEEDRLPARWKDGFHVEVTDTTLVRDLMTPVVFSVAPDTPVADVVHEMTALRVHRLFVVDRDSVLVGVISALDVLRHLG